LRFGVVDLLRSCEEPGRYEHLSGGSWCLYLGRLRLIRAAKAT
jgi:hypothetical protein